MKSPQAIATLALVWLIGLGMGVPLGARYEYSMPAPTESQTTAELALCMAETMLAERAMDSVEVLIRAQRGPVAFDWAGTEVRR